MTGTTAAGVPQPHVYIRLKRPEGYEDVHPELVLADANVNPAFEPEIVEAPSPGVEPAQSQEARMGELAAAIHYPDCWDIAAYPTLEAALSELSAWFRCSTCQPAAGDAQLVGTITSMVKGGVTWSTWPDELPDGTHLYASPPSGAPAPMPGGEQPVAALREALHQCDVPTLYRHAVIDAFNALLGAGAPAPIPAGWRPIETAPKGGPLLIWVDTDDGGEAMTMYRNADGEWLYEGEPTYCAGFYMKPTHWMPLPPPPLEVQQEGVRSGQQGEE